MRGKRLVILALVAALGTTNVWGQQTPPRQPTEREGIVQNPLPSTTIIGARVKNSEGKDLGKVDRLLIDENTGQVSQVVLGLGGLAGVGESKVVVAWKDIRLKADPDLPYRTIASVEDAVIERAPRW